MSMTVTDRRRGAPGAVSAILFLCLFAGQAGLIALSPLLTEVARDLDVSTAVAGQLRTIAGLAAGVAALAVGRAGARWPLQRQLLVGVVLLGLGSLASAAVPSLVLLAGAQALVGVGVAVVTTAGTLAAAEWVAPEQRTRVLSWALIGQPAAWIIGMPLIGLVGQHSWRYAWLVLPLTAALLAFVALAARSHPTPAPPPPVRLRVAMADPRLARWLTAELLVNTAWAGTLVYSGALFIDSYAVSTQLTGLLLATAAAAFVAGNVAARYLVRTGHREVLVALALALAASGALLGAVRPSLWVSTALFSAMAAAAGARTLVSSAFGLGIAPELRPAAMGIRAASMQFGYFVGSFAAGTALALGGYTALGLVIATLFLLAAWTLAARSRSCPDACKGPLSPLALITRLRCRRQCRQRAWTPGWAQSG